ncbi:MAG TPA: phosphotransferase family protein [Candidatus Angelobacter sp.]|nr:phosphotransferase family protein [Candidatus Angelobacter sp.]
MTHSSDTAAVRQGEELNTGALSDYLRGKVEGAENGVAVEQFPGGHSNLTYHLRMGGQEYVLRRAPLGPVAPKAHDMAREFRLLKAVHPYFPEAPQVYHLCEDASVIGAVFFVMERRRGVVLRDSIPSELSSIPDYQRHVSEAVIDCMIRLHAIDVSRGELSALGKPEGFVERQVQGWAERWKRAKTEEMPIMDQVMGWLKDRLPPSLPPTLVHNDYKLDNIMLRVGSADVGISAVLDWEMTTLGDPLSDLGLTLCYWTWATAPEMRSGGIPAITGEPGWYTREQFVRRYADKTGRDLTHLGYHEVMGVFKLAVILQQIYFRFHRGQTQDQRFKGFGERVRWLSGLAGKLMEENSK